MKIFVQTVSPPMKDLEKTLEPILYLFKLRRRDSESFGDFTARVGFDSLRQYSTSYVSDEAASQLPQVGSFTTFRNLRYFASAPCLPPKSHDMLKVPKT